MSAVTLLATNPTSGLDAYTCGKRLVSGWVCPVIAVLNSKKSFGTAATGGVPLSDEIPTAVGDAGDRIGDNGFDSAEVVAVGGLVIMGNTAGGAISIHILWCTQRPVYVTDRGDHRRNRHTL